MLVYIVYTPHYTQYTHPHWMHRGYDINRDPLYTYNWPLAVFGEILEGLLQMFISDPSENILKKQRKSTTLPPNTNSMSNPFAVNPGGRWLLSYTWSSISHREEVAGRSVLHVSLTVSPSFAILLSGVSLVLYSPSTHSKPIKHQSYNCHTFDLKLLIFMDHPYYYAHMQLVFLQTPIHTERIQEDSSFAKHSS